MSDSQSQPKTLFQIIKGWLRNGSIEVASASKIGRVRLNLSDLRQDRDQALLKLGEITYQLIQKGAIKSLAFSEQADKVKSIDKMIIIKDAEIKQYVKEKERKLLGAPDAAVSSVQPPLRPQPQPQKTAAVAKPQPTAAKEAKPAAALPEPKPAAVKDKPAKPAASPKPKPVAAKSMAATPKAKKGKAKAPEKAGTKPTGVSTEKTSRKTASVKQKAAVDKKKS